MVKNYKIKAAVPGYFFTLQFLILSLKKRVSIVMPIYKIMLFGFISILSLLSVTCKNEVAAVEDNAVPGRRDYVWTVDTLDALYSPRGRMWGSSPTDVWATSSSNLGVALTHYNGSKWVSYRTSGMVPNAIYGFSSINIVIGAYNGQIWKFNGNNWNLFYSLKKDGHSDIVFSNIWGESINFFYVNGAYPDVNGYYNKSVIALYNNGIWYPLNTSQLSGIVTHVYRNISDNKIYLQVNGYNFPDSTKIYEYNNGEYIKLYGNIWTKGLQADISLINGEVYFVLGNSIVKRKSDKFITLLNVDNPNFYQRIWGKSSKDIFLLMTDGLVHYNGTDTQYLFHFTHGEEKPWTQISGTALFDKEVFFVTYEPPTGLSLVYHGKLE